MTRRAGAPHDGAVFEATITTDAGAELTPRLEDVAPDDCAIRRLWYDINDDTWEAVWPHHEYHSAPGAWPMANWLIEYLVLPTDPTDHAHVDGPVEGNSPVIHEGASVADDEERTWTGSVENHP